MAAAPKAGGGVGRSDPGPRVNLRDPNLHKAARKQQRTHCRWERAVGRPLRETRASHLTGH